MVHARVLSEEHDSHLGFPIYLLVIITPIATPLINSIPYWTETFRISSQTILTSALCLQGIGFLISVIIYSAFIYRLMAHDLPSPELLPSMLVSVGPAGFTATGVLQLGSLAMTAIPRTSLGDAETVTMIIRVICYSLCLCLWGLTLWFVVLSMGGQWGGVWYSTRTAELNLMCRFMRICSRTLN